MPKKMFKKRKRAEGPADLDITSLLDILTILLVFLLRNYNATDLKLDLVDSLSLPDSKTVQLGSNAVIIQVNKKRDIYVDNKQIGTTLYTTDKIKSLYDELKRITEEEEKKVVEDQKKGEENKPVHRKVNIVLDQDLPYEELRKIMHTSAEAGYPEFKLIVQGHTR